MYQHPRSAFEGLLVHSPDIDLRTALALLDRNEESSGLKAVQTALDNGDTVQAIKEYRALFGSDLRTAHAAVHEMIAVRETARGDRNATCP